MEESDYVNIDSSESEAEQECRKYRQTEAEAGASGESDLYMPAAEVRRMKKEQQWQRKHDGVWHNPAVYETMEAVYGGSKDRQNEMKWNKMLLLLMMMVMAVMMRRKTKMMIIVMIFMLMVAMLDNFLVVLIDDIGEK